MVTKLLTLVVVVFSLSAAFAQTPATPPALGYSDSYQLNYLPSLAAGTFVNIANPGFHSENSTNLNVGWICADIYTYQPNEEPRNCCTCPVSANGVRHLLGSDFAPTAFGPPAPVFNNVNVKIVATRPIGGNPAACNAALPAAGLAPPAPPAATKQFATGLRAWATKVHTIPTPPAADGPFFYTEDRFSPVPLSANEYAKLTNNCAFFQSFGTGAGICNSCLANPIGSRSVSGGTAALKPRSE